MNIELLIAILMKNEDVFIKIPSQAIFDEACLALKLVGIEFDTRNGTGIQVISLEGKRKREKDAARQLAQLQQYKAQTKIHEQMMKMVNTDFL